MMQLWQKKSFQLSLLVATCFSFSMLSGCSSSPKDMPPLDVGFVSTQSLQAASEASQLSEMRKESIRTTAAQLGTQGGLAWRAAHINKSLTQQSQMLDQVFNFQQLLLKHNVLPPVLTQTSDSMNLSDNDTIRLADHSYTILKAAKFVTVPPTWRDYLWMSFKKPNAPASNLLPRNAMEAHYWNQFFKEGWKQGLIQANTIFAQNLNQLKQAYEGMILYRKLLSMHVVSAPFVSQADLGITGDGHHLRIGDRVLRITSQSQLEEPNQWKPVITKGTKAS
jgi:defect-in-organelle-trafficking protein DotC